MCSCLVCVVWSSFNKTVDLCRLLFVGHHPFVFLSCVGCSSQGIPVRLFYFFLDQTIYPCRIVFIGHCPVPFPFVFWLFSWDLFPIRQLPACVIFSIFLVEPCSSFPLVFGSFCCHLSDRANFGCALKFLVEYRFFYLLCIPLRSLAFLACPVMGFPVWRASVVDMFSWNVFFFLPSLLRRTSVVSRFPLPLGLYFPSGKLCFVEMFSLNLFFPFLPYKIFVCAVDASISLLGFSHETSFCRWHVPRNACSYEMFSLSSFLFFFRSLE